MEFKIAAAVLTACKDVSLASNDAKIARALELLGIDHETAHNYGLACFDTKSIHKSVRRFF